MPRPYWEVEKGWDAGGNCLTCGEAGRCRCHHPLVDMNKNVIGDVELTAVRYMKPVPHWRVKVDKTGYIFSAGVFKGESRPKMWESVKRTLRAIGYDRFNVEVGNERGDG